MQASVLKPFIEPDRSGDRLRQHLIVEVLDRFAQPYDKLDFVSIGPGFQRLSTALRSVYRPRWIPVGHGFQLLRSEVLLCHFPSMIASRHRQLTRGKTELTGVRMRECLPSLSRSLA